MKTAYMMLSGLILAVFATLAIAGLISISELAKPAKNQSITKISAHNTHIKMTHKEGICHHNGKDDKVDHNAYQGR